MEGAADRGRKEEDDSIEGRSEGLDDFRDEITEKYPADSVDQQQTRPESVENHEASSETESGQEQKKAEPTDTPRSDTAGEEGKKAEHFEASPDHEAKESDLDRLRDDVREKYPQVESAETDEKKIEAREREVSKSQDEPKVGLARENSDPAADTTKSGESISSRPEAPAEVKEDRSEAEGEVPSIQDMGAKIGFSELDSKNDVKGEAKAGEAGADNTISGQVQGQGGKVEDGSLRAETPEVKELPTHEPPIEVTAGPKGIEARQAESSQPVKSVASDRMLDAGGTIEDKRQETGQSAERDGSKEIKTAERPSGESRDIIRRDPPLPSKEVSVNNPDQSNAKRGKKLDDLERVGAGNPEQGKTERKEPEGLTPSRRLRPELPRQEKRDVNDTIPVNANLRNADPISIRFDIPKKALERTAGFKIEEDKLYHIKGTVVGKYDFEMHRMIKGKAHHFVPVENHHQIQGGKVYDIRITSVKEVSLTPAQNKLVTEWKDRGIPWSRIVHRLNHMPPDKGEIKNEPIDAGAKRPTLHQLEKLEHVENIGAIFKAESRLQRRDKVNREDRFYFRIDNSEYRQRTGMSIEEGATYRIKGEIEGVGQFEKKLRSVATGQNMPIYVPRELNNKIELGKEYKITINSVERIPSVRDSWERLERPSLEWSWKEIASWIDTEGRINSINGYYADVCQKDKIVIQEICGFYDDNGLRPHMLLDKSMGAYHAHLHRVEDVATVVKNIEPYIRTENKREQIREFKDSLSKPRKRLHGGIMKARKILGL